MGKTSLERVTGLTKEQRIARAKKRAEDDRKARLKANAAAMTNLLDLALKNAAMNELIKKAVPEMLLESLKAVSGDTVVPPTPQNPELKEEKTDE